MTGGPMTGGPRSAPEIPGARAGGTGVSRDVRYLPGRIWRGRPLRLLARALATCLLALAVLHLVAGQPAAPALVTGLITWFLVTARADLAPPPARLPGRGGPAGQDGVRPPSCMR